MFALAILWALLFVWQAVCYIDDAPTGILCLVVNATYDQILKLSWPIIHGHDTNWRVDLQRHCERPSKSGVVRAQTHCLCVNWRDLELLWRNPQLSSTFNLADDSWWWYELVDKVWGVIVDIAESLNPNCLTPAHQDELSFLIFGKFGGKPLYDLQKSWDYSCVTQRKLTFELHIMFLRLWY